MTTSSASLLQFFTQMDNQGGDIVRDQPTLDLDLYIQNYRGRTRFDRLILIGRTCVPLCVDALKAAVIEAKKGTDVGRYREAVDALRIAAPEEVEARLDEGWVKATVKRNNSEIKRLENELKVYRNNLVKESIRMAHQDIGLFYEGTGSLREASDAYNNMRPDVGSPHHLVDVGKHLVSVAVQLREWGVVIGHLAKMSSLHAGNEEKNLIPFVKIMRGIALMGIENYAEAAQCFLSVNANTPAKDYNEYAAPNDIAAYGVLLSLATLDREKLQTQVLENQNFRPFLELESHLRKAVSLFVNGRYTACLSILESHRSDYRLDIYLRRHVAAIYKQIRTKCIVQFFIPYSCVTLSSMTAAFARQEEDFEAELRELIQSRELNARINEVDQLLEAVEPDSRAAMQLQVLEAANAYQRGALERLRRMGIFAADLDGKSLRHNSGRAHQVNDTWYDEEQTVGE